LITDEEMVVKIIERHIEKSKVNIKGASILYREVMALVQKKISTVV